MIQLMAGRTNWKVKSKKDTESPKIRCERTSKIGIHGNGGELPEKLCGSAGGSLDVLTHQQEAACQAASCNKLGAADTVERLWQIVNI